MCQQNHLSWVKGTAESWVWTLWATACEGGSTGTPGDAGHHMELRGRVSRPTSRDQMSQGTFSLGPPHPLRQAHSEHALLAFSDV